MKTFLEESGFFLDDFTILLITGFAGGLGLAERLFQLLLALRLLGDEFTDLRHFAAERFAIAGRFRQLVDHFLGSTQPVHELVA